MTEVRGTTDRIRGSFVKLAVGQLRILLEHDGYFTVPAANDVIEEFAYES